MGKLEQIVRPYVSGQIRPATPVGLQFPVTSKANVPTVWGAAGQNAFQLTAAINQKVPPAQWPKSDETQRTYDVVRVFNKDDKTQFVDVEAMTEYQARNKIDGSRITLRYATNTNTDTTQVMSTGNVRKSSGT